MLIITNSTGSVKYVLCTERCLPASPGAGSGARPARMSATIFFWPGMMTKKTFATMIVPIITPTCTYAARAPKTWKSAQDDDDDECEDECREDAFAPARTRQSPS